MEDLSFTKSKDLSAFSTTESSSHGRLAPFSGVASNHPGEELAAGLFLTWLLLVALLTLLPPRILLALLGRKLSHFLTGDFPKNPSAGGIHPGGDHDRQEKAD